MRIGDWSSDVCSSDLERAKPDSSILVRAKSVAFWRRARSSSDMGCSFIGGAFLGGVVAGEVFGADRAGDRVEMLHAVNEPGQFVGGDFIGMGIAGLDIGALQLREMAAGGAGIARPGFEDRKSTRLNSSH